LISLGNLCRWLGHGGGGDLVPPAWRRRRHLRPRDPNTAIAINYRLYDSPEQRYCPAGVFEIVHQATTGEPQLQDNAQDCVHRRTCDIKDPEQDIHWVVPEGGGGPNYPNM
jgi:electron-transferring-flavoprotein dehydrogenase